MRLLFVENRYTTWVFEPVTARLAVLGHEIHWLVQNPMFAPRTGRVHRMPFPPRGPVPHSAGADTYEWLRRTDRGVLHFRVATTHYPHYDREIAAILDALSPDAVFGEATEFHELLTIRRCRERDIAYLSPNATRYPTDRLAFMAYDSLEAVGGDGSHLPDEQAEAMLEAIRTRQVVPSYLRPSARPMRSMASRRLADKLRVTAGWLAGERFITPSPARKMALNAEQRRQRRRWEEHAARGSSALADLRRSEQPWVLYALQMQPEGNIDVWGAPWNDQAEIIRRAAAALAADERWLVVKPNPKSKYELNDRLIDTMARLPNVVALPHATAMREVFPPASLVLAVTGTVLLECLFAGKPVAVLGDHAMAEYPGVNRIAAPEDVRGVLAAVGTGTARRASRADAIALLRELHRTSYPGVLFDPMATPEYFESANIAALTAAFADQLNGLARAKPQRKATRLT